MTRPHSSQRIFTALIALVLSLAPPGAMADGVFEPVRDPVVRQICGECHLPFSANLLPRRFWQHLMQTTSDHFGEILDLKSDDAARIASYLTRLAGDADSGKSGRKFVGRIPAGDNPLRITGTPGFLRKHRLPDRVWRDPNVVTRSNCAACHQGAEQGLFDGD